MDSIDKVYDANSIHLTFKLESGSLKNFTSDKQIDKNLKLMTILRDKQMWYCTISINLAVTHHRPSGFGWNQLLVPCHKLSGWLENPKGHFGASHGIQAPHAVAKIWCPSQAHQCLADAKILASRSQVTPLDELIKIVQYIQSTRKGGHLKT